ncbi:MAG: hypothetical protein KIS78_06395 [Labilithrix sp.]|nr:hypothetical protein [Labilithrix sp.]
MPMNDVRLDHRSYPRSSRRALVAGSLAALSALGTPLPGCGGSAEGADLDAATSVPERDASSEPRAADAAPVACDGGGACTRTTCDALGPDCATLVSCPSNVLCEEAFFLEVGGSSSGGGGPVTYATNGPDTTNNARCALEALRDGRAGAWSWGFSGGIHGYHEQSFIVADRRAAGSFGESIDAPLVKGAYAGVRLKPSTFFEQCLASNDVDAWARCLRDAFEPCPP